MSIDIFVKVKGMQGLLAVPRNSDHSFIGVDRHYVKQVIDCLTSSEILQIIDWTIVLSDPKCVRWYVLSLMMTQQEALS